MVKIYTKQALQFMNSMEKNISPSQAVLKLQAPELDAYIKNKNSTEACSGFIDGFEKACQLMMLREQDLKRQIEEANAVICGVAAFFRPEIDGRYENEQEKYLEQIKDYKAKYIIP